MNMTIPQVDALVADPKALVEYFRKHPKQYGELPDESKFYIAQEDQNIKANRR